MCKFCENDEILIQKDELICNFSFGWGNVKIDRSQCSEYSLSMFIDRGYLRLVDPTDSGCLDHGEKVKIFFCPMCGKKLN